jgi:hypothetical protein
MFSNLRLLDEGVITVYDEGWHNLISTLLNGRSIVKPTSYHAIFSV